MKSATVLIVEGIVFTLTINCSQVTDLLNATKDPSLLPSISLPVNDAAMKTCCRLADQGLQPSWEWLQTVLDGTESQLRFGLSLSGATDPSHPSHPLHDVHGKTAPTTTPRDRRAREDAAYFRSWENKRKR